MLQTLLWSSMTCFLTFLKYPLAVLAQTPATYILMYGNAFSTTFTAVRCFQLRKKVLRLNATSYQGSERTVQNLCLWLQNEHEWQFCKEFAPHPRRTNDNDAHVFEPNYITVQNKIIAQILPVNIWIYNSEIFVTPSFNEWVVFSWLLRFALQYMFIQIGSQTWASLSFVPPILAKVRIPPRAAARAHFLVINKGAGQFYLSFNTR